MKRHVWYIFSAALLVTLTLGRGEAVLGQIKWEGDQPQATTNDLLVNGSMEGDYHWHPPNHYIAPGWERWWIHGTIMPEFEFSRGSHTYYYDGNRAQVYFKWGDYYTAGIYQVVSGLTPCTPYELKMWGRSHSLDGALPHAKIGLDPQGTDLTPDGAVKSGLPPYTAWSGEQTNLFVWEQLSVQAEPWGNSLTAILYAAPRPGSSAVHYFDTYWDAGSLTQTTYPNGKLPQPASWTPTGFIYNITATPSLNQMIITWNTSQPAPTQVWYNIIPAAQTAQNQAYAYATPLDLTPVTSHRAVIDGLHTGDTVQFVALSRRLNNNQCVTEASASQSASALLATDRVPPPDSWVPSGVIQSLNTTVISDSITVSWETPGIPSTTQVWYDVTPPASPVSPTVPFSHTVYLPLMARGDDHKYEFATDLDLTLATQHQAVIENLNAGDSVYLIALSSRVVNGYVVTEISDPVQIQIAAPLVQEVSPQTSEEQ